MIIVAVVLHNAGWIAIKALQQAAFGEKRAIATDFLLPDGTPHIIDFAKAAEAFGCHAEKASKAEEIGPALERCLKAGRPALLDIKVWREFPDSGSPAVGWWDVPIPSYLKNRRKQYEKDLKGEKLQ